MNVDVLNESGVEVDVVDLTKLCRYVMRRMRLHPSTELCLRLVDPATIAVLNQQWMDKKGPTDVLSFPMDELSPGKDDDEAVEGYLGDIALCPQVAEQQAPAAGHSAADEIELLTVHGILHLLGYDHGEPDEHKEMFGLQGRLLSEWGSAKLGVDPELS
ncbi:MAG: rRNA maturation RNase YbeY [Aeromicrobium sp.]